MNRKYYILLIILLNRLIENSINFFKSKNFNSNILIKFIFCIKKNILIIYDDSLTIF